MAVTDLWVDKDGMRTKRYGRGLRWRASWPGHPSKAFRTKGEAQGHEAHMRTTPAKTTSDATVGDLVQLWLAGKQGLEKGSYTNCRVAADTLHGRWGSVPVADLTRAEVQAWFAGMEVSASTQRRTRQALGGVLTIAAEMKAIPSNWGPKIKVAADHPREPRYLSVEELRKLADASLMPAAVMLMGTCGPRVSECLAFTVGNVDAERKVKGKKRPRIRVVKSKTKQPRDVPLPASVLAMLDLDRAPAAPLLVHPHGGPVSAKRFREHVLYPAARKAGLEGVRPHDLRHTAVSLAIAAGANVKAVQRMVGHKTITVTLTTYGHLFDDDLDVVALQVDALLAGKDLVQILDDAAA